MKKVLLSASLALYALASAAATLNPVQLLNPAGSASGQAIISTGASTAPAWGNVAAASLATQAANTVLANVTGSSASPTAFAMPSCSTSASALQYTSGTGFTCYTNSATTTGTLAQFAATTSAQLAGVLSDETGSGSVVFGTSPTIGTATINTPTISGGTITNAPISGSTGSFTTLAASSTVSGTGFSTYLASPPAIGTTTAAAGKFTTLQATSAITPAYPAGIVGNTTGSNVTAGSVGEPMKTNATSVSLTSNTATNIVSETLTAGDWDVQCVVQYVPAGTTTVAAIYAGVSTTSAAFGGLGSTNTIVAALSTGGSQTISSPVTQVNVSTNTPTYCVGLMVFGVSTATANASIVARRR